MATTTKTRISPAQREVLLGLIRAAEAAKAVAAVLAAAEDKLKRAERDALPILSESRTIRDDSGALRTISVSLDKSFTAAGTPEQRVIFAKKHGLKVSAPDCTTSALKSVASEATEAGLLVAVPKIVID